MTLEEELNLLKELDLKGEISDEELDRLYIVERLIEKEKQKHMPKQVIVIRKDLNMNSGKLGAQVAHASWGMFTKAFEIEKTENGTKLSINLDDNNKFHQAAKIWFEERFTKVVVYVKSEAKLLDIYKKAIDKGLPACLIEDAGFTVFNKPTKTCVGIGPVFPEDLIGITNKLQMLKD